MRWASVWPVSRMSSSKQNVAVAHVRPQFGADAKGAGRDGFAAITGRLDEADAQRQIDVADEVGQEHEAAGEDADDGHGSAVVVVGDLPGQLGDAPLDALGGKQDVHEGVSDTIRRAGASAPDLA